MLPCWHEKRVVDQVQPTINLLSNMDVLHPDILLEHAIEPSDYKGSLVFRSAVESIVANSLRLPLLEGKHSCEAFWIACSSEGRLADYRQSSSSGRFDFTVVLQQNPDIFADYSGKRWRGQQY